jgi:hypothetical protein
MPGPKLNPQYCPSPKLPSKKDLIAGRIFNRIAESNSKRGAFK